VNEGTYIAASFGSQDLIPGDINRTGNLDGGAVDTTQDAVGSVEPDVSKTPQRGIDG